MRDILFWFIKTWSLFVYVQNVHFVVLTFPHKYPFIKLAVVIFYVCFADNFKFILINIIFHQRCWIYLVIWKPIQIFLMLPWSSVHTWNILGKYLEKFIVWLPDKVKCFGLIIEIRSMLKSVLSQIACKNLVPFYLVWK